MECCHGQHDRKTGAGCGFAAPLSEWFPWFFATRAGGLKRPFVLECCHGQHDRKSGAGCGFAAPLSEWFPWFFATRAGGLKRPFVLECCHGQHDSSPTVYLPDGFGGACSRKGPAPPFFTGYSPVPDGARLSTRLFAHLAARLSACLAAFLQGRSRGKCR